MKTPRIRVREARKQLSTLLNTGKVKAVGGDHRLHGFIVGLPPHDPWNAIDRQKALQQAKANFLAAWKAEAEH
jgi:hypothetical protein